MYLKYKTVREPCWANEEKTQINCLVFFNHLKHEVPFTAYAADCEAHGREIFQRCVAGDFGEIEPMPIVPQQPSSYIPLVSREFHEFDLYLAEANKEYVSGTERGFVLVWTSIIEEMLYRLLKSFLIQDELTEEMLQKRGLRDFNARIKMAYVLGLISKEEMQACRSVIKIRNDFAHKLGLSLESPPFKDQCRSLHDNAFGNDLIADYSVYPIKFYFSAACARLASSLGDRSEDIRGQQRKLWDKGSAIPQTKPPAPLTSRPDPVNSTPSHL